MANTVEQYLVEFEEGKPYVSPPTALTIDSQPDPAAVEALDRHLAHAGQQVRLNIVRLLVDLGLTTDPNRAAGGDAIRNARIIEALARSGLHRADSAREEAILALRKHCTQADLAVHGEVITLALRQAPTQEAFLLVAKAKPPQANPVVTGLAQSEAWKGVQAARFAQAALGEQEIEDEYLSQLELASDGEAVADALPALSLIGTNRCLVAVAQRLRSPLTIHVVGAFEKSIRLDVLLALIYHFPYEPILNPNCIMGDSDYEVAEQFCTKNLGVDYTEPRPTYLTIRGYPS